MERRDLIKSGLASAAALAGGTLPEAPPAEAAGTQLAFYEGTLNGHDFAEWSLWLAVVGKRVQGIAYDTRSARRARSRLRALRVEGRLGGRMHLYSWRDGNHTHSIGDLQVAVTRAGLRALLQLRMGSGADISRGEAHLRRIPVSRERAMAMAGHYDAVTRPPQGRGGYTAQLTLRPNLTWELRRIQARGDFPEPRGGSLARVTGHYAVAADGRLLVAVTRVPLPFRSHWNASSSPSADGAEEEVSAAAAPSPARHFEDADFPDELWDLEKIIDATDESGTVKALQQAKGGHPDPFRRVTLNANAAPPGTTGQLAAAHFNDLFVHEPLVQGAIERLDFSYDLIALQGNSRCALMVQQQNGWFAGPLDPPSGAWQSFQHRGLTADDFTLVAGTGHTHPNFTDLGVPIAFGFMTLATVTPQGPLSAVCGIDNYSLALNSTDAGSSLELSGPRSVGIGVQVEYLVTARTGAGAPLPNARIVLAASSLEGPEVAPQARRTDAGGEARFPVTFVPAGDARYTVDAFLDQNGDGIHDPAEPAKILEVEVTDATFHGRIVVNGVQERVHVGEHAFYDITVVPGDSHTSGFVLGGLYAIHQPGGSAVPLSSFRVEIGRTVRVQVAFDSTGDYDLFAFVDLNGDRVHNAGEPISEKLTERVHSDENGLCDAICAAVLTAFGGLTHPNASTIREVSVEHPLVDLRMTARRRSSG